MNRPVNLLLLGLLLLSPWWGAAAVLAAEPVSAPAAPASPISQPELWTRIEKKDPDLVILDVRTPAEYAAGHVPGALNVSHDQLPAKLAELGALKDKEVVLYCRSGRRAQIAAGTLRGAGFDKLRHLEGDWQAWETAGRPVEGAAQTAAPSPNR